MPEEIPWNSSVFPEKASPRPPREPWEPPMLNLPQRGAPPRYVNTPGPRAHNDALTHQPTRPLRAHPLAPGFHQAWPFNQPLPFTARPALAFPPVQPPRFAPQGAPAHLTHPRQAATQWPTPTMPRSAPQRPFATGQSRPLAQPTRPRLGATRLTPSPFMPFPAPARPAFQPAPASFTAPTPAFQRRPGELPEQADRMIPLTPAWPRQPAPPWPAFVYTTGPGPAAPLPFPREERNQTRATPQRANLVQPQQQISTSAWRKTARASQSRLLLASTLLFLIAMMLVLGLMNMQQQARAIAAASSLPYAPYHGKLVLNDPLHNPGTTWETSQNSTRCAFHAGSYHVIAAQYATFATCSARELALTNFALQVEMTLLSGDRGGIVFRLSHAGGYFFSLDRMGHYSLAIFNGKTSTSLLNGSSSAIVPGQTYLLAVIAVDQQLELYVNQQKIANVHTTTFNGGTLAMGALAISQPTEAVFNDLKVWQL